MPQKDYHRDGRHMNVTLMKRGSDGSGAYNAAALRRLRQRAMSSRKEVIRRRGTRHDDDGGVDVGIDVKFSWTPDTARRLLHYKSRAGTTAPALPRSILSLSASHFHR